MNVEKAKEISLRQWAKQQKAQNKEDIAELLKYAVALINVKS